MFPIKDNLSSIFFENLESYRLQFDNKLCETMFLLPFFTQTCKKLKHLSQGPLNTFQPPVCFSIFLRAARFWPEGEGVGQQGFRSRSTRKRRRRRCFRKFQRFFGEIVAQKCNKKQKLGYIGFRKNFRDFSKNLFVKLQ